MLKKLAGTWLSAALLAACSGGSNGVFPSTAMHGASVRHSSNARHGTSGGGYEVLHSFGGSGDGLDPYAELDGLNGVLYGTTESGGTYGFGTAFSITTSGTETVLHSFYGSAGDAADPEAALTPLNGVLYGTSAAGGANNFAGTVFSITTAGTETVLHSFSSSNGDGFQPLARLAALNGVLYGTTGRGGAYDLGTVFSVTAGGAETVLHSFGGSGDGRYPQAGLAALNGVLYGTTGSGGSNANPRGTVFSITPGGTETVMHSFGGSGDGQSPVAGLAALNGVLYGTTENGGSGCNSAGCGTVFSITTGGSETVLHEFGGLGDGTNPFAPLRAFGGILYGTTKAGGNSTCYGSYGCGTVFSITTGGSEAVLHSFGGSGDGKVPVAGVKVVDGALYGTTKLGGANNAGTVFALPIPTTETVIHNFGGGSADGTNPMAPLLNVSGTLYGTTVNGGASNAGTVYSIVPSYGTETVLHNFTGSPDGANPYAGLVNRNGTLYGTTPSGGAYNAGTIYSIIGSGMESVLKSFYTGSDGQNPMGGLVRVGRKLYGTTTSGGVYNAGTAFSVKTSGGETVLHNFGGGSTDGVTPHAPMLDVGGTVYGTTTSGGAYGNGTVFAIPTKTGRETVLHSFGGGSGDGTNPQYGQLVSLSGTMYGTTLNGGAYGRGTIYSITPYGTETVLHSFGGGSGDGTDPYGGLVNVNGVLYGTTSAGGAYSQGTLFSIAPNGTFIVLWDFGNAYDGARPRAGLININGLLYGTTTQGGMYGGGTVFTLSL